MSEFEYWYVGMVIVSTGLLATVFTILHTHVWVRKGYEGLDEKLELVEVDRFVAHVMAEACLVLYWILITTEPLLKFHMSYTFPGDSKIGLGVGFLGSAAYTVFKNRSKGVSEDK